MTAALWVTLTGIVLTFLGTIYGHYRVSKDSREKTTQAVKEEMKEAIQTVKDEMRGVREESQAKDEEMHAEIILFKQETASGLELIRKDIGVLSTRVERHNGVVDRTYALEQKTAVQEEQIKVANHRIEDLEKLTAK